MCTGANPQIPHGQVLYALNGMIVGLTRVDPTFVRINKRCMFYYTMQWQIADNRNSTGIKFLTERVPLAEYLGYGMNLVYKMCEDVTSFLVSYVDTLSHGTEEFISYTQHATAFVTSYNSQHACMSSVYF